MGFKPIIDVTNLTACCVIRTLSESKEEEQPYFSVLLASLKTKNVLVTFSVQGSCHARETICVTLT